MKTLLKTTEELEGKTIESVEIETGYYSKIVIKTKDDSIMILSVCGNWDRCGDYEGTEIEIETESTLGFAEKVSYDLLTNEDIEFHKIKEEEKRKKKELEEKKKAEEAAEKMKKSELELLAKLKIKYENQ